jgi:hypothetical protein
MGCGSSYPGFSPSISFGRTALGGKPTFRSVAIYESDPTRTSQLRAMMVLLTPAGATGTESRSITTRSYRTLRPVVDCQHHLANWSGP